MKQLFDQVFFTN